MKLKTLELVIFAMLGAVMYVSKVLMEFLPNIHLLGTFVVAFTVVYRKKALYPIYVFVMLMGLFNGFNTWWICLILVGCLLLLLFPTLLFIGKIPGFSSFVNERKKGDFF